ncbi:MAG: hypothetical protein HY343_12190 [Lentisphaerae bacterium]|nr:hypothetical protein [Lentisphaerota bacterium]
MKAIQRLIFKPIPIILLAGLLGSGCASVPYQRGHGIEQTNTLWLKPDEPQIERGKPYTVLDGIGNLFGIPAKIILLNWKMDRHSIAPKTEAFLVQYLKANELNNVKVRLNQYAPRREWKRLVRNKAVGAGYRYTFGILSMLFYTILPERIFGGDNYNPYSNTINIYSDVPAVLTHEGGHAKDFAKRKYKGTYAVLYLLPFFALYPEAKATGDAIGYMKAEASADDERAAFKVLYPAYGTYIGGELGMMYLPWYYPIYLGAVAGGHVVGRIKAAKVKDADHCPAPDVTPPLATESAAHAPAPADASETPPPADNPPPEPGGEAGP